MTDNGRRARKRALRKVLSARYERAWLAWNERWDDMLPNGSYFGRRKK